MTLTFELRTEQALRRLLLLLSGKTRKRPKNIKRLVYESPVVSTKSSESEVATRHVEDRESKANSMEATNLGTPPVYEYEEGITTDEMFV